MASKTTNTEKAGNYPRSLADLAKKLRGIVADKKIDVEIKKGQHWENVGAVAAGAVKGGAKVSGVVALWLIEYMTRLFGAVAVDNFVLRKMEQAYGNINPTKKDKEGNIQPSKVKKFMKNNPTLMSYLTYYMMIASIVGGGKLGTEVADKVEDYKIEKQIEKEREELEKAKQGKYAAYLDKMKPITPLLIADLIAKEGVRVNEQGLHVVYDDATGEPLKPGQKAKGKPTIGFGATVLKDGKEVTSYTEPITTAEAYELARHHLESGETYFRMYCYDVAVPGVDINTTNQALGMASIIYNAGTNLVENPKDKNHKERFTRLHNLYKEHGFAMPDSLVLDMFAKYPVRDMRSFGDAWLSGKDMDVVGDKLGGFVKQGRGLYWRRWLEAGLLNGQIKAQMLLDCPVNGMYEFFCYMKQDTGAFFVGDSENRRLNEDTYAKFKIWLNNPINAKGESLAHWKKVKDYLPDDIVQLCMSDKCEVGNKDFIEPTVIQEKIEKETYVIGYDQLYADAVGTFRAGDFQSAAEKYNNMIKKYPDNALLRNDLAATYNKLGQYEKAIEHARYVLHEIGDKSQYGAAQYNAGFAYEQMGNLQKALANYKLALANGNRRVQKDITRVSNRLKNTNNKQAWNSGIKQMHQKNAKRDVLLYGQEFKGNMA